MNLRRDSGRTIPSVAQMFALQVCFFLAGVVESVMRAYLSVSAVLALALLSSLHALCVCYVSRVLCQSVHGEHIPLFLQCLHLLCFLLCMHVCVGYVSGVLCQSVHCKHIPLFLQCLHLLCFILCTHCVCVGYVSGVLCQSLHGEHIPLFL